MPDVTVTPPPVKSGFLTSEFALSVLTALGPLLLQLTGHIPGEYGAIASLIVSAVVSGHYTLSRERIKSAAFDAGATAVKTFVADVTAH